MGIWKHQYNRLGNTANADGNINSLWMDARNSVSCMYCNQQLTTIFDKLDESLPLGKFLAIPNLGDPELFRKKPPTPTPGGKFRSEYAMTAEHYTKVCPCCGWWIGFRNEIVGTHKLRTWGGLAGLLQLDLDDISLPMEDVRQYLIANYELRFELHPRKLEELVADVFKDMGYKIRVTSYSNDGGIDVFLDGNNDVTIGVQVKRYKNTIGVGQIRELTGALVLHNVTKGIFVTTSGFQAGVQDTVDTYTRKGYPIELYDANRLFDALKLTQSQHFDLNAPYIPPLVLMREDARWDDIPTV